MHNAARRLQPLVPTTTESISSAVNAVFRSIEATETDLDLARRMAREIIEDSEGPFA